LSSAFVGCLNMNGFTCLIWLTIAALPLPFAGDTPMMLDQSPAPPAKTKADDSAFPKLPSPHFAPLEMYVGPWSVVQRHFDVRGEETSAARGSEENTWALDYHVLQRKYTTTSPAATYRASGTLTFNEATNAYEGVWYDNASTWGATTVKGEWQPADRTFVFTLERLTKDKGTVRYKVVERFVDKEHRTATTYLLSDKEVVKQLEVEYTRTSPCPDRLRVFFDE